MLNFKEIFFSGKKREEIRKPLVKALNSIEPQLISFINTSILCEIIIYFRLIKVVYQAMKT